MAVMAAGMHDAVHQGRVGAVGLFRQGQGVRISTQQDDRAGQSAPDEAGHARTCQNFDIFYTHEGQLLEYSFTSVVFFVTQFRVGVEVLAHFHHIR